MLQKPNADSSFQLWSSEFLKALGITSHDSNYYPFKKKPHHKTSKKQKPNYDGFSCH